MNYDIVLPTRNRHSVLQLSIPLMLKQSRTPESLIVVDSSDNHDDVRRIVESIVKSTNININLKIFHSDSGSSYQRNIGLKHTVSEIIMFPDDDSLWFPIFASSVMKIYENDIDKVIGAVAASESLEPPYGVLKNSNNSYKMSLKDRLQLIRSRLNIVNRVEDWLFPDPFIVEGMGRQKLKEVPNWLCENNAQPIPSLIGFRMTFRNTVVQSLKFDEVLGRYALFEDRDVSLGVLREHLIVEANDAKVFHYRSPENRVPGDEWGVMSILNMAYIICKHTPIRSESRGLLRRYCYYRGVRYLLQIHNQYGRRRAIGTWKALMRLSEILNSPQEEIVQKYMDIRNDCLR